MPRRYGAGRGRAAKLTVVRTITAARRTRQPCYDFSSRSVSAQSLLFLPLAAARKSRLTKSTEPESATRPCPPAEGRPGRARHEVGKSLGHRLGTRAWHADEPLLPWMFWRTKVQEHTRLARWVQTVAPHAIGRMPASPHSGSFSPVLLHQFLLLLPYLLSSFVCFEWVSEQGVQVRRVLTPAPDLP